MRFPARLKHDIFVSKIRRAAGAETRFSVQTVWDELAYCSIETVGYPGELSFAGKGSRAATSSL